MPRLRHKDVTDEIQQAASEVFEMLEQKNATFAATWPGMGGELLAVGHLPTLFLLFKAETGLSDGTASHVLEVTSSNDMRVWFEGAAFCFCYA